MKKLIVTSSVSALVSNTHPSQHICIWHQSRCHPWALRFLPWTRLLSRSEVWVKTVSAYCTSSTISLSISAFNCSLKVDILGHCAHSLMWHLGREGLHVIWVRPCLWDFSGISSNVTRQSLAPIHINLTFWCTVQTDCMCATSSYKNTFLQMEICKLGKSNSYFCLLCFEWFICFSEVTENKVLLYFNSLLHFLWHKIFHPWHHMTNFIRSVPLFDLFNCSLSQSSPS